jgi:hypothetical protein
MIPLRVLNQRSFTRASIAARIALVKWHEAAAAAGPGPGQGKQRAKPKSSPSAWRVVRGAASEALLYGDKQVVARENVDAVLTTLYDNPSTKATGRDQLFELFKLSLPLHIHKLSV